MAMPSSSLACLLLCLCAVRSAVAGGAAGGSSRFLAKAEQKPPGSPQEAGDGGRVLRTTLQVGEQCGIGLVGSIFGNCADGLQCVPPAAGSLPGAPNTCQTQCGSFDAEGDHVNENVTCGSGRECSGKAPLPCKGWDDGCYMYCTSFNREGQTCSPIGSDGHNDGECGSRLVCAPPAAGSPPGTPYTCQKVGLQEGQQCGTSGSTGYFYGSCSPDLRCAPPADGAMPGTPSLCRKP